MKIDEKIGGILVCFGKEINEAHPDDITEKIDGAEQDRSVFAAALISCIIRNHLPPEKQKYHHKIFT